MNILITICARGGSKGIPGKNIKILNGKPLVFYSLHTATLFAAQHKNVDLILSTDDCAIKKIVEDLNFDIDCSYDRPESLASDSAGKIDAIKHVLDYAEEKNRKKYAYVLDLDITSPLRTVEDLNAAFGLIEERPEAYNIFSVSPANRNPYFNMVEEKEGGYFTTSKHGTFFTRQSAPKVYDMNASFYIYRDIFFEKGLNKAITDQSLIYEVPHLCFDLDHPVDFHLMSYLMEKNLLDFKLI